MLGIVLNVYPSDHEQNASSTVESDDRGWRHECTVLALKGTTEIYMLLENVVIPPSSHSGMDNFDEELPRGLNARSSVDGELIRENFFNISPYDLDAEWCVINFVGGSIKKPFIQNWWYHPRNKTDLATAKRAQQGTTTLKQVDVDKNRFRKFKRLNGTRLTVNTQGDVYLDTTEANNTVEFTDGKLQRQAFNNGGSLQVNVKHSQQLELNWNTPVEGLAAGSTSASQTRDESLSHASHIVGAPAVRETTRTLVRTSEFSQLTKTSSIQTQCSNTESMDGKKGEFIVSAEDSVQLVQGDSPVASFTIQNGNFQLIAKDGTTIYIQDDEIVIKNKSGGMVNIAPGGAITALAPAVILGDNTAQKVVLHDAWLLAWSSMTTSIAPLVTKYAAQPAPPLVTVPDFLVLLQAIASVADQFPSVSSTKVKAT
jgi:hypothetical protein